MTGARDYSYVGGNFYGDAEATIMFIIYIV